MPHACLRVISNRGHARGEKREKGERREKSRRYVTAARSRRATLLRGVVHSSHVLLVR